MFGIPRAKIADFLGGVAAPMPEGGGFFEGLRSGLGGALNAGARRSQSLEEIERDELLRDLEERRTVATETQAGAAKTTADASMYRAQHPNDEWSDPTRGYNATLGWLQEKFPQGTNEELIPMIGGIDAPPGGDPTHDPAVTNLLVHAYATTFGVGEDQARLVLKTMRPQRYTDEETFAAPGADGKTRLHKQIVTKYAYGIPALDAILNQQAPAWGGGQEPAPTGGVTPPGGDSGDLIGTLERLSPNMSPEDQAAVTQALQLITGKIHQYHAGGRR